MNLYWFVLLPILIGLVGYFIPLYLAKYLAIIMQVAQLIMAGLLLYEVRVFGPISENLGNWPDYVGITLKADYLSAILILLNVTLFFLCGFFNVKNKYVDHMFLFLFLSLEGLISGIFLSNDLFNIFVMVEISVVIVSILIMFKRDAQSIYDGMIYLLTNTVSMTLFLFGIAFLYKVTGCVDLKGAALVISEIEDPRSLILPYTLMITAVSLKAALMPLFSWLPKAHGTPSAPSVVSAILSGIYIKTGVYLFIRIQTLFSSQIDTSELFLILGFLTALIGFLFAMFQSDIKLMLAYSTVSQIGLIMIGVNMNSEVAMQGAIYHIISHGIFKTTLFLTAGMIVDEYQTRNIYEIRGLWKRMPVAAIATMPAILGMIGMPLFSGSMTKYWLSYAANGTWLYYGMILLNFGTILIFIKFSMIFTGKSSTISTPQSPLRKIVILLGGALCLIGGLFALPITYQLFGSNMPFQLSSYLEKSGIFFISLVIAVPLYYFGIRKWKWIQNNETLELSFNEICVAMFLFLFILIFYVDLTLRF